MAVVETLMRKIKFARNFLLIFLWSFGQPGWNSEFRDWANFKHPYETLPGRADLFFDDADFLAKQFRIEPSLAEKVYQLLTQRRNDSFTRACEEMLKNPSEQNQIELTERARAYFGIKSSRIQSMEEFEVPPATHLFQRHWLNGFALYLKNQPWPVKLNLRPIVDDTNLPGKTLASVRLLPDSFGISLYISLVETRWPPTNVLGHELFHLRQIQGQLFGSNETWPRHRIRWPVTNMRPVIVDFYLADPGCFFIEEIGAYLRDSIAKALKSESNENNLYSSLESLLAAREFAEVSDEIYQRAITQWSLFPDERSTMYSLKKGEVKFAIKGGGSIDFHLNKSQESSVSEGWVVNELTRGQFWVRQYLKGLGLAMDQISL